jgi:glycosyltransferase involved in cell wall biosynthesis
MARPRILTFLRHYLPGYRSGGPIRTIASMVEALGDEYEFLIVTRDRDSLDSGPYRGVHLDEWIPVGKAKVRYLPRKSHGWRAIRQLMVNTPYDLMYLNSVYALESTLIPLVLRTAGAVPRRRCAIAPRGELSGSAVGLDPIRKRPFLTMARRSGLYGGLTWQASGVGEARDIQARMEVPEDQIVIAPNIVCLAGQPGPGAGENDRAKHAHPMKMIFLSRLAPEKNVVFLLEVLRQVKRPVTLDIVGPWADAQYRRRCEAMIAELPSNVNVRLRPPLEHDRVEEAFRDADLFAFPTLGESFGHVIIEALAAGTPVLASDQTPWRPDAAGAFEALPLDRERWRSAIEGRCLESPAELAARRDAALQYAVEYLSDDRKRQQNIALFERALGRPSGA